MYNARFAKIKELLRIMRMSTQYYVYVHLIFEIQLFFLMKRHCDDALLKIFSTSSKHKKYIKIYHVLIGTCVHLLPISNFGRITKCT